MSENIEKRFPKKTEEKRNVIPLKVSPEAKQWAQSKIEKLKSYTNDIIKNGKYAEELNDFTKLAKDLVIEKGEEYKFEEILVEKEGKAIHIEPPLPQYLIIPEKAVYHYKELKKIMLKKPYLYEILKMGIKEIFSHEREHRQGAAAILGQEIHDIFDKTAKTSSVSASRIRLEHELEKQVEFQRIMTGGNKIIDRIVSSGLISDLLHDGIDKVLDLDRVADKKYQRGLYKTFYSSLPEDLVNIEDLVNKHFQIVDELKKEYEEWKKESEKEKR